MNSEKVKEIKDRLQEKLDYGLKTNGIASPLVSVELLNTTLIIIEELEASNKTKYDAMVTLFKEQEFYKNQNQQLKDRLAELEKENARLLDGVETVQSNRCRFKCELTEMHLKQFIKKFELNIGKHLQKKFSDYEQDSFHYIVDKADVDMCLDETLKEFLCDNNQ